MSKHGTNYTAGTVGVASDTGLGIEGVSPAAPPCRRLSPVSLWLSSCQTQKRKV